MNKHKGKNFSETRLIHPLFAVGCISLVSRDTLHKNYRMPYMASGTAWLWSLR